MRKTLLPIGLAALVGGCAAVKQETTTRSLQEKHCVGIGVAIEEDRYSAEVSSVTRALEDYFTCLGIDYRKISQEDAEKIVSKSSEDGYVLELKDGRCVALRVYAANPEDYKFMEMEMFKAAIEMARNRI